jgi:hypothetical protein
MKYSSIDYAGGGGLTIYYSDANTSDTSMVCQNTTTSERHAAFTKAMQWCARKLGLPQPPTLTGPQFPDERPWFSEMLDKAAAPSSIP